MNIRSITKCLMPIFVGALFAGCGSTQSSRMYLLNAPVNMSVQGSPREHLQDAKIVVTRIQIPKHLDRAMIDYFHIDIMDGHFVPNLALNFDIVKQINNYYYHSY